MAKPIEHPGFYVWSPINGPAHYQHAKMEDASAEAQRLAAANPGHDFFVMAPVAHARSERSPVRFKPVQHGTANPPPSSYARASFDLDDEIPF